MPKFEMANMVMLKIPQAKKWFDELVERLEIKH